MELEITGVQECAVVGGTIIAVYTTLIEIEWLGEKRVAEVIINEGNDLLLGTSLLTDTILTINYIDHTVDINHPE
jgi:predicted aspartyl protease